MNDLRKSIKKLLTLKNDVKILVNHEYECRIIDDHAFSTFTKNANCPAYDAEAIVDVVGHDTSAKLTVMWNLDIDLDLSCCLCLYDDNNELASMISVIDLKCI